MQQMAHDIHSSTDLYAQRFAGSVGDFFTEIEVNMILDALHPWPNSSVLDVGGGHARVAPALVEKGYSVVVTGSDESCRLRIDRALPKDKFGFELCEPDHLPFEDNHFDIVICTRQMAHEENWMGMLDEMCRVAKQTVLIDYPSRRSVNILGGWMFSLKQGIEKTTRGYTIFSDSEIIQAFNMLNFGRPSIQRQFLMPMALYRMLRSGAVARFLEGAFRAVRLTNLFGSPVIAVSTSERTDSKI